MLLRFFVCCLDESPSLRLRVVLRFSSDANLGALPADASLSAFCFPLGAENETPKRVMSAEVCGIFLGTPQGGFGCVTLLHRSLPTVKGWRNE